MRKWEVTPSDQPHKNNIELVHSSIFLELFSHNFNVLHRTLGGSDVLGGSDNFEAGDSV
jgi:hypothetical protein